MDSSQQVAPYTIEQLAPLFPALQVKKLIAVGGMGGVYLAHQIGLDRPVALKILPPVDEHELGSADRFVTEARLMAQLSHPNIVSIYDFGRTGNLFYFIMEYVRGGTFHELIQAEKINASNATQLMIPICAGVSYAHKRNVLHHDLKPGNLMLNDEHKAKLLDFGLAGIFKPGHRDSTAAKWGTADYAAPERFTADAPIDHRADLYSLGVIYYEMLTGNLPKEGYAPPSKSTGFNVKLDEIIGKCLAADPDQRYPAVADFELDLKKLLKLPRLKSKPAKTLVPVTKAASPVGKVASTKRTASVAPKIPTGSPSSSPSGKPPVVKSVPAAVKSKPAGPGVRVATKPKPMPVRSSNPTGKGTGKRRPPPPQDEAKLAAQKQAQAEWEVRMKAEKKKQETKTAVILLLIGALALGLLIFFMAAG